jgi:hypothetical protein
MSLQGTLSRRKGLTCESELAVHVARLILRQAQDERVNRTVIRSLSPRIARPRACRTMSEWRAYGPLAEVHGTAPPSSGVTRA